MCWKIEVWIKPMRDPITKKVLKPGIWKTIGEVKTLVLAKDTVIEIANRYGVAQATFQGDAEGGWCGMRAYRGKTFCCWTGSGGHHGV